MIGAGRRPLRESPEKTMRSRAESLELRSRAKSLELRSQAELSCGVGRRHLSCGVGQTTRETKFDPTSVDPINPENNLGFKAPSATADWLKP